MSMVVSDAVFFKVRSGAVVCLILIASLLGKAQTTYFEQNFDGAGPFVGSPASAYQFDILGVTEATTLNISNGALEFTRPSNVGGTGQGIFHRTTSFSPLPTALYYEVDISVTRVDSVRISAAFFYVGENMGNLRISPPNANVFARFAVNLEANNLFSIRYVVPSVQSGTSRNSISFPVGQTVKVIMAMNQSDKEIEYFNPSNPSGPQKRLLPKTLDLWINNVLLVSNQPAITASVPLSNIAFVFNNGAGTIRIDNMRIRDIAGILPVRYTFTKAEAFGESVQVAWQTASEHNSREFVVQRSKDLREWSDLGRVAAAGQSARLQTYTFLDENPLLGVSYYRLRQLDHDGRYEYSAPFEVIFQPHGRYIRVLGNPVSDNIIRVKLFSVDPSSLRLSTLTGQSVLFEATQLGVDSWVLHPLSPLASGVYLLHASQPYGLPLSARIVVP